MLIDRNITAGKSGNGQAVKTASKPDKGQPYDTYYSRLIKLIPSEIIAFYLAMDGIVSALPQKEILLWIIFGIALVGSWFYLGKVANVSSPLQKILTIVALAIWVFVFGGPFTQFSWYDASYGKMLLVLFTFFVPVFFKGYPRNLSTIN
jgi:hypothetical protein